MNLSQSDLEALASLTDTHAKLSQQLGHDHPAVKSLEAEITALSGAKAKPADNVVQLKPKQAQEMHPALAECDCAGCQLAAWLVDGYILDKHNGDAGAIFEALWLESEQNSAIYQLRLKAAMDDAKTHLDKADVPHAMQMCLRGLESLKFVERLADKYPKFKEPINEADKEAAMRYFRAPADAKGALEEMLGLAQTGSGTKEIDLPGGLKAQVTVVESKEQLDELLAALAAGEKPTLH